MCERSANWREKTAYRKHAQINKTNEQAKNDMFRKIDDTISGVSRNQQILTQIYKHSMNIFFEWKKKSKDSDIIDCTMHRHQQAHIQCLYMYRTGESNSGIFFIWMYFILLHIRVCINIYYVYHTWKFFTDFLIDSFISITFTYLFFICPMPILIFPLHTYLFD